MPTPTLRRLGALAAAALSCATASAAVDGLSSAEVKIGMVNVQTGPASGLGKGMKSGAEALFKSINAKGGVHGRQIKLVIGDDGYEPDRSVDETLKMIEQEKVFSLFGYVGTPTTNAVLPIVKEMDVPLVGAFTGAMTLRQPVTPQVFNVRASYDDEAEKLVAHFLAKGAKSVAVFYQDDGFGTAVLSGTEKALKKRSMAVAAKSTFQRNTLAIKAGLAAMLDAKPDAVVMVGPYAPLAAFIKEARAAGLKSQLATVSFVGTDNLVAEVGAAGDGVVISQVVPFPEDNDLPIQRECRDALAAGGEKLGFVNFEGCITAKVMVAALERAGKEPERAKLVGALKGMQGVDIGGMKLAFGDANHQAFSDVFLTQIQGGRIAKLR
ncbi:MAG: ABC transporter substrate-binding protein [Rubrivivax sp.]|jgi:ABC-type branched-subunit amino acid transport system substrate-binding protein|nr:ABC transporter substrate-binding protein [Rubrivivax sp.]